MEFLNLMKKKYQKTPYKVILETSGIKFKGAGKTTDDAIADLGLSWEQIKAKGVMTISQDKKSYQHLFFLKPLRRIFANKITRLLWAKRLQLLL